MSDIRVFLLTTSISILQKGNLVTSSERLSSFRKVRTWWRRHRSSNTGIQALWDSAHARPVDLYLLNMFWVGIFLKKCQKVRKATKVWLCGVRIRVAQCLATQTWCLPALARCCGRGAFACQVIFRVLPLVLSITGLKVHIPEGAQPITPIWGRLRLKIALIAFLNRRQIPERSCMQWVIWSCKLRHNRKANHKSIPILWRICSDGRSTVEAVLDASQKLWPYGLISQAFHWQYETGLIGLHHRSMRCLLPFRKLYGWLTLNNPFTKRLACFVWLHCLILGCSTSQSRNNQSFSNRVGKVKDFCYNETVTSRVGPTNQE